MQTILVGSDLSVRSDRAIRRAVQLAKEHGAQLVVAHVMDDDLSEDLTKDMRTAAEKSLAKVLGTLEHVDAVTVVIPGEPVEAMLDLVVRFSADLVVLGTHKERAFRDIFSGTTMERIVKALPLPVLLVKEPVGGPYASVLCGVDLSPSCAAAANTAAALAPAARLTAFHAVHVPYSGLLSRAGDPDFANAFVREAESRLDHWWPTAGMPARMAKPKVTVDSVSRTLAQRHKELDADLYAVGAHGRSAMSPSLLGGFTEELIRNPTCDVLIVRR